MNTDEVNKVYIHCANHRYMGGYAGDESYMIKTVSSPRTGNQNTYYVENYYQSDANDASTIDRSRHVDGHSKILGMSYDGYPIYGPYGYNSSGAVAREVSSYRNRVTAELQGARQPVTTTGTVTYAVTISNGQFYFDGSRPAFLDLDRGKEYIFNQNDASNLSLIHI